MANILRNYEPLAAGTSIKFKSGLQADLNLLIKNGGAEEGTFYLTTDTHKFYVGRKNTTTNIIYPEQVSRGVTIVESSGELPATTNTPSGAIEEGELYYITESNVLAALRKVKNSDPVAYEWVQINPPTGIDSISGNAIASTNDVILSTNISTGAGAKTGAAKFVAGDNITLTANGNESIILGTNSVTAGKFTISAKDTTYELGTEATPSGSTDGAILGLKKDGGSTLET